MLDLRCIGIEKSFGANRALDGANLSVRGGTIHALLGENGAGKSTLNHIISGDLQPDSGALALGGCPMQFNSPLDAAAAGIGMVHQHFLLADALTVAENIALGNRTSFCGLRFDKKNAEARAAELAENSGLHVDPRARVGTLSVGLRQRVEILKALSRGAKILLLDEPTAVLAPAEVARLFETLRKLRDAGRTIVIVTHKLDEVFDIAQDVTVLRRGATVFEGPLEATNRAQLAHAMIGRALPHLNALNADTGAAKSIASEIVLEASGIRIPGQLEISELRLYAGEIVGVAGVEGNGQDELSGLIAGTLPVPSDAQIAVLKLCGSDMRPLDIRSRVEKGLALIPSDRQREGLVLEFSLVENLFLRDPILNRFKGLDGVRMNQRAQIALRDFGVDPPSPELSAGNLSGGNQQKLVAARELGRAARLVLACNPTRGLDVGAAVEMQNRIVAAARRERAAVLLISSDLDEILALSDRVFALHRGTLSAVGARGVSRDAVGRAMLGADARAVLTEAAA